MPLHPHSTGPPLPSLKRDGGGGGGDDFGDWKEEEEEGGKMIDEWWVGLAVLELCER